MNLKSILYILILIFVLVACKKEESYPPPVITFISPEAGQKFEIPNTLFVEANISAETHFESIKVQLTDSEFIPVLPAIYVYPNKDEQEFHLGLPYKVDDISLTNGTYYLLIRADIINTFKNQYQEIELENNISFSSELIIITKPALNTLDVYSTADYMFIPKVINTTADYISSDVDQSNDQLFIAGENITNIQAWDMNSYYLAWEIGTIPYKPMHNPGCLYFDEFLFASFNQLYIMGYRPTGEIYFSASVGDNDAPRRVYRHEDFLLADVQKKTISNPTLNTYYVSTGALKQELLISFSIVEFFSININTLLIFANDDLNGRIFTYDIPNNNLEEINGIDHKIRCAEKTNSNNYLIGTVNSVIPYELALNVFHENIRNEGADHIDYNQKSGKLHIALDNKVDVYNYPGLEYQKTLTFSDTILNIHSLVSQ